MKYFLQICGIIFLIFSCAVEKREGVVFEEEKIDEIKIGSSIEEIKALIGSPSLQLAGTEKDEHILVYVSAIKKNRAFFREKTESQTVLELRFLKNKLYKINKSTNISNYETREKIDQNMEITPKPPEPK